MARAEKSTIEMDKYNTILVVQLLLLSYYY